MIARYKCFTICKADVTDTTVVYTLQIHYRHDHDRRKMATHSKQTTTTNQP